MLGFGDVLTELHDMTARYLHACDQEAAAYRHAAAVEKAMDEVRAREASTRKLFTDLIEPPTVGECIKVRLRSRNEADAFARRVERESGAPVGALEAVQCRRCPRQPVTTEKFWHIRHVRPSQRNLHGSQYAHSRPRELGRISPADMAKLKARFGGVS
jgi:hypothetical protein